LSLPKWSGATTLNITTLSITVSTFTLGTMTFGVAIIKTRYSA